MDTIVVIGATSTSVTLTITGIGLIVLPKSAGIACTLSLGNKVKDETFLNKYNKHKKTTKKINKQSDLPKNYTAKVYEIIGENEYKSL